MGPSTRSSRQKRQTRLAFSPLPSSSPQSSNYPAQMRERAAAVIYEGSPSSAKRRKIHDNGGASVVGNTNGLATPRTSSQIQGTRSDSDSEPVRTSSKKIKTVKASKADLSSPLRSSRTRAGIFGGKDSAISLSSEDDSSPAPEKQPNSSARITRGSKSSHNNRNGINSGSSRRITRSKVPTTALVSESEDDIALSINQPASNHMNEIGEAETSGDEIIVKPSSSANRSTNITRSRPRKPRASGMEDFIVDSDSDSDSDVQIISKKSTSRPLQVSHGEDEHRSENEEDDEEDVPVTPRKRLSRPKPDSRTPRKITQQEREELKEDLEFLQSSDDDRPKSCSRTRKGDGTTPKQNARAKALEMLKKRRAGKQITISDDDDDDDGEGAEMARKHDQGVEFGNEYDSDSLLDPASYRPHNILPSSSAVAMFEEDENDEGFITEDEEDTLGAPASALPIQFSGLTSRKPKELFKFAVEWMVQKKFNPAFQMEDDVYRLAFNKLDDEVKGLVGSKFMSAAWTADFTRAVQSRPQIEAQELPKGSGFLHDKCGACNRSGHPATWKVRFTGKPYHEESLEEVEQDYDDDDDSGDDEDDDEEIPDGKIDYDSKGRPIPSAKKTFEVGKFCMRNAMTGHALAHWRYHLNEWVIDYLRDEGYLTPDKIVERDGWNTRKRRDFANSVVDDMEEKGEIKRLHKDYRTEIDSAREVKTNDRFFKS